MLLLKGSISADEKKTIKIFILKWFGLKMEEKQKMFVSVTDLLMEKHFVLKCLFMQ